jgi:hypothetical protein
MYTIGSILKNGIKFYNVYFKWERERKVTRDDSPTKHSLLCTARPSTYLCRYQGDKIIFWKKPKMWQNSFFLTKLIHYFFLWKKKFLNIATLLLFSKTLFKANVKNSPNLVTLEDNTQVWTTETRKITGKSHKTRFGLLSLRQRWHLQVGPVQLSNYKDFRNLFTKRLKKYGRVVVFEKHATVMDVESECAVVKITVSITEWLQPGRILKTLLTSPDSVGSVPPKSR